MAKYTVPLPQQRRVVAIHGCAGAGKSTLLTELNKHLPNGTCSTFIESLDRIWCTPTRDSNMWFISRLFSSTIYSSTKVIRTDKHELIVYIFLLLIYVFTGNSTLMLATLCLRCMILLSWQVFCNHLLSKLWNYNVNNHRRLSIMKNNSDPHWIFLDRNCIDVYGFCCIDQPNSVPNDFLSVLIQQTNEISVGIIMDTPHDTVCKHLAARLCPNSTKLVRVITKLLLKIPFMINQTLDALPAIEQWYKAFNVPVIRMSKLYDKFDMNSFNGEVLWTERSIQILLEEIDKQIKERLLQNDIHLQSQQQLFKPWMRRGSNAPPVQDANEYNKQEEQDS
ncbi:unnamed protein product [Didymodactylos carnosus]|uniref:Uncharacterized protein n=1 Tax=Didymodactylos carnosus TaxID=1234261 RepID=A0A8S2FBT4_9BILA|nr:unnamed protein product [Didymodactylos carnosus]CAF4218221.1 unnamed protein product [Didymodactylos carnosus]